MKSPGGISPGRIGPAIFLLSGAALAYEVILVRLLAMTRFHHLAFMVLSLALLAYGLSGVLLAFLKDRLLRAFRLWFATLAALFAVGTITCFQLSQRIAVAPAQWVWSPAEALGLVLLYLVLALPLLAAATAVGLAYCHPATQAGRVYRADLQGAAAGSLMGLAALWLPEAQGLWIPWCAGLTAAALIPPPGRKMSTVLFPLLAISVPAVNPGPAVELRPSPDKPLAMALAAQGSQLPADLFTPLGRLSATRNTLAPYRHAPGLSLAFRGRVPAQDGLFIDGEGFEPLPAPPAGSSFSDPGYLDYLPEALAYHLAPRPRVLILDSPVMEPLARAKEKGAAVEVVVSNPGWRRLAIHERLPGVNAPLSAPGVRLTTAAPRGYLRTAPHTYDLIVLGAPGPSALKAQHRITAEAIREALGKLDADGALSLSGPSDLPPRTGLRLLTTAAAALKRMGAPVPGDHLILIRSLRTVHLLVSRRPLTPVEVEETRAFCRSRRFDPVWFPGMAAEEANRWNRLAEPLYHRAARQLLGPEAQAFLQRYKFDLTPVTDNRPYFSRFLKPATLVELLSLRGSGGLGMLSLAEPVLAATLVQAALLGLLAVWLPLRPFRPRPPAGITAGKTPAGWLYFLLGAGFMLAEFALLEKMVLFLNQPVLAVGVTLAAFLALAGVGGSLSTRLLAAGRRSRIRLGHCALAVVGLQIVYAAGLPFLLYALMGLPLALRLALAPLLMAPLALAMGLPFPLAMATLKESHPQSIPWGWGLNGCGSLVGPVVGMGIAVYLGVGAVMGAAAICYCLAAMTGWEKKDG